MGANEVDYKNMMDLFGDDKLYYATSCWASFTRTEEGMKIVDEIDLIPPEYRDELSEEFFTNWSWKKYKECTKIDRLEHFGEIRTEFVMTNDSTVRFIEYLLNTTGVRMVAINNIDYDMSLGLNPVDFYEDDHFHPGILTGYMEALALYCVIYGEPAVGQNRGVLKDRDIPGDTPEEKNEFVLMLQTIVQEQVDMQRID